MTTPPAFSSFDLTTFQSKQQDEQDQRHGQLVPRAKVLRWEKLRDSSELVEYLQPNCSSWQNKALTVRRKLESCRLQLLSMQMILAKLDSRMMISLGKSAS